MIKTIKNYLWHLLNDKSPLNAAIAIGLKAFFMMCVFAIADIFTGLFGKDLVISDIIYQSFVAIVFAAFFKSVVESVKGNKNLQNDKES
jgi:hypothetical protein